MIEVARLDMAVADAHAEALEAVKTAASALAVFAKELAAGGDLTIEGLKEQERLREELSKVLFSAAATFSFPAITFTMEDDDFNPEASAEDGDALDDGTPLVDQTRPAGTTLQ